MVAADEADDGIAFFSRIFFRCIRELMIAETN